jgi:hypothetical protein
MRAKYYISFDAVTYSEFFPSNTPKVSFTKESEEVFFRKYVDKFVITRSKNQAVFDVISTSFFYPVMFSVEIKYSDQWS